MNNLNTKTRIILIAILIISSFFLLGGKYKSFGKLFLIAEKSDYAKGDLYDIAQIELFRERILDVKQVDIQKSGNPDLVMMGDSFFNKVLDSSPVPNIVSKDLNINIEYSSITDTDMSPLQYLEAIDYKKGKAKKIIWETVERKSVARISKFDEAINTKVVSTEVKKNYLEHFLFDRKDTEYFIKNNYIIKPINLLIKDISFKLFGEITDKVPVYSVDPPFLYYFEDVDFYNDKTKLAKINILTQKVANEAKIIKEKYGLDLYLVIIPDKLNIYGKYAKGYESNDNFLAELGAKLKQNNLNYLDVYSVFKDHEKNNPTEYIYYKGDSHYNLKGKEIVVNLIKSVINK